MRTIENVIEGMIIIQKCTPDNEDAMRNFRAGHDQIWCGDYPGDNISEKEINRMKELGWFEDEGSWSKII